MSSTASNSKKMIVNGKELKIGDFFCLGCFGGALKGIIGFTEYLILYYEYEVITKFDEKHGYINMLDIDNPIIANVDSRDIGKTWYFER
tara:strand:- start:954 stop:1220 length:267 start_codon:yes stop_codon:yes gene_type:complete